MFLRCFSSSRRLPSATGDGLHSKVPRRVVLPLSLIVKKVQIILFEGLQVQFHQEGEVRHRFTLNQQSVVHQF